MEHQTKPKVILCDIEGTTTSISFVKDVLFPYANENVKSFVSKTLIGTETHAQNAVRDLCTTMEFQAYFSDGNNSEVEKIVQFFDYLTKKDIKLAPFKTLQGLIWEEGYAKGRIQGHVFADVAEAFKSWTERGIKIAIYSSGSVMAQKLLFESTEYGNLCSLIGAHFDTSVGPKRDKQSYSKISNELGEKPSAILFLTDIVEEGIAAQEAGLQVVLLSRPGNAAIENIQNPFTIVSGFNEIMFEC